VAPLIESDSVIVLTSHVRRGGMATILPQRAAELFVKDGPLTSVPIKNPDAQHAVGLIVPHREPYTPVLTALLSAARKMAEV